VSLEGISFLDIQNDNPGSYIKPEDHTGGFFPSLLILRHKSIFAYIKNTQIFE
jgi:hypothetical protein